MSLRRELIELMERFVRPDESGERQSTPVSQILDALREVCEERVLWSKMGLTAKAACSAKWEKIAIQVGGAYRQVLLTELKGR